MLRAIKSSYFGNTNYTLIYIHNFFYAIALSIMYVFAGAYFLKLGMPLPFVLLFYGLEFGLRGALVPFGVSFLNRVGVLPAMATSALFSFGFFVGISMAEHNLWLGFSALILSAIGKSINTPIQDVYGAMYIKDDTNRGKQMAMYAVLGSLGKIIGTAAFGFMIEHYGFNSVLIIVGTCLAIGILPFIHLRHATQYLDDIKPLQVYKFLANPKFKPLWPPFFGEQLTIIVAHVMVPLFIFSIVDSFDHLGYLIAAAIVFEKALTLLSGHFIDKSGGVPVLNASRAAYAINTVIYAAIIKNPLSLLLAESYNKTVQNIFQSTLRTEVHKEIRKDHPDQVLLLGACWQMALCFGELLVLPIYALMAHFIGMNVFYVACAGGLLGVHLSFRYFNSKKT